MVFRKMGEYWRAKKAGKVSALWEAIKQKWQWISKVCSRQKSSKND